MKILFYCTIAGLLGILACKSTQNNTPDNSLPTLDNGIWRFEAKTSFSRKDTVKIQLYHESKEAVRLQRPLEMKLEVEEKGTWRTIKKLYCPCQQGCPNPPRDREMAPQERFTFQWIPVEQFCEPSLKTLPAPVGKYRLIVNHMVGLEKKMYIQHYLFKITK